MRERGLGTVPLWPASACQHQEVQRQVPAPTASAPLPPGSLLWLLKTPSALLHLPLSFCAELKISNTKIKGGEGNWKAKYFAPKESSVDLHTDRDNNGIQVEGKEILYRRINAYRDITHRMYMLCTVVKFLNGMPQWLDLCGCQKPRNGVISSAFDQKMNHKPSWRTENMTSEKN